ncbi:MAG TPA: GatB/YqeY domain-containing protein [Bacillales bacterium]|nr:GatB/YqeY domain-containing protein [Bacillales bacterium]
MSLKDRLTEDLKQAMKAKEKKKLSTLRMIRSSLQNEQIKLGRALSEDEEITVLSRELKQRKDSLQEYEKAGREDLAEGERADIAVIQAYLPEPLSEEDLERIVDEAIAETGAEEKGDMGKVMSVVMPRVKGKADGSHVNRLVQQKLSK